MGKNKQVKSTAVKQASATPEGSYTLFTGTYKPIPRFKNGCPNCQ